MLVLAFVSSAECFAAMQTTVEQHACCAAMKGQCEMAVSASCCPTESQRFVAPKATTSLIPVAVLVAVLGVPPVAPARPSHVVAPADASSSGPPGVPTYLFVSSFRI